MGIDWTKAYEEGKATPTTPPAADATPAVPAAAYAVNTTPPPVETPSYEADPVTPSPVSTSPASGYKTGGSVSSGSSSDLWRGLVGAANDITEFGSIVAAYGATGDFHMGNYGRPYGHNLMKVASTSGYDFTTTFVNTASEPMTINCWNKVGPDILPLSGSALAPKNTTLTMYLKPGASQVVAVQENSQIACSEATDNFAASGAFAESWFEANFVPTGSGYDLSAIMSSGGNNYDMSIACEEVECISDPTQNFWVAEFKPVGGSDGSCYVPPGPMHLTAKFGGKTTKYGGSI
ncbi:allergen Asp f 4 [Diplocarpon rosae]|nr:allergen Asp f 4 [Diplocarpon rosae]